MERIMEWSAILFLGAFHGINPGMGWLFAVALGMQQGSSRGVWRALPPLAAGHAAAVGAVLLAAALAQTVIPIGILRPVVSVTLVAFGLYRLVRHRHPRWVGMQVGFGDLTAWSFLMASAHGAGLMILPFVMRTTPAAMAMPAHHAHQMSAAAPGWVPLLAVTIHSLAYLGITTIVAWTVYRKLGLALLRKAWWNLDLMWAASLVVTGVLTLLL
jgi:hypothetical protein